MGVVPKCVSYLHVPGDNPFKRKAPLRLRDTDIDQHNGGAGDLDISHTPGDITEQPQVFDSAGFPQFSLLPTEIRLQIWNAFLMMQTYEPRVINISVGTRHSANPYPTRSVLKLLNLDYLRRADGFRSLLQTNWEAREATIEHLETHPPNHDYPYGTSPRQQKWMGVYRLNRSLHRAGFDPARDVLFLSWSDNFMSEVPQSVDAELLLPERFEAGELAETTRWRPAHQSHGLNRAETDFTSLFRTFMMPVHGLVDREAPEGVFSDPMWPTGGIRSDHKYERMEDKAFIALVGGCGTAGENLQMKDIEFIPDETVEKIRREAGDGTLVQGTNRRLAESVLHRDVLLMTAVWNDWKSQVDPGRHYIRHWNESSVEVFHRRRLRFARVKEGVIAQLGRDSMAIREN